jgi:hypothetical protein
MKAKNLERLKSLGTLLTIFIRPTPAVKQIDENPNFWFPLGVYTVILIAINAFVTGYFSPFKSLILNTLILHILLLLIQTTFPWLMLILFRSKVSFQKIFTLMCYFMPFNILYDHVLVLPMLYEEILNWFDIIWIIWLIILWFFALKHLANLTNLKAVVVTIISIVLLYFPTLLLFSPYTITLLDPFIILDLLCGVSGVTCS